MPTDDAEFEGFQTRGQVAAEKRAGRLHLSATAWRAVAAVLAVALVGTMLFLPHGLFQGGGGANTANASGAASGGAAPGQSSALPNNADGHMDDPAAIARFVADQHSRTACLTWLSPGVDHVNDQLGQWLQQDQVSTSVFSEPFGDDSHWTGNGGAAVPARWDYSDKLSQPLSETWQLILQKYVTVFEQLPGSPGGSQAPCDTVVALVSPDWDGALRSAYSQVPSVSSVIQVDGPEALSTRFGDTCNATCGSGTTFSVVDMQHVYVWKGGRWVFYGPA